MAVTISDELVETVARKMAEREGWSLPNDLELGYAPGSRVGKTMAAARLAVEISAPLIANAQIEACAEVAEQIRDVARHQADQLGLSDHCAGRITEANFIIASIRALKEK